MKIIVPMAGTGDRFVRSGYNIPKPLINVDGKLIIKYVVELFSGENDFVFICNKKHLKNTNMALILKKIKPKSTIIGIGSHKGGPVFTIKSAFPYVKDNENVIVCYCDFNAVWDYEDFKSKTKTMKFDGAVPCYIGFHPHLLHKKLYAGVLVDKNGFMKDIREKHCFTDVPTKCHQSCGIYYFKKGSELKKYQEELMKSNINLNGEYYISMIFYLYKRDKLKVYVPEIAQFAQWGTPEDLEEYESWSRYFAALSGKKKGVTTEPVGRNPDYRIKLNKASKEYKKSYGYWKKYFSKSKEHPYGK